MFLLYGAFLIVTAVFFVSRLLSIGSKTSRRHIPSELLLFLCLAFLVASAVLASAGRASKMWFVPRAPLHVMSNQFYEGDTLTVGLTEACYTISPTVSFVRRAEN